MKRRSSFKRSGRSATRTSPTLFSVGWFKTRPKAPSVSWWQIKTTERWKNEPRSWPLSSSNWPLSDWKSPVITTLSVRTCPRLAPLTMGITLRHDDPNFADRFAAGHIAAHERMQNKRRQPRIHSRPGLGADAVGVCDRFSPSTAVYAVALKNFTRPGRSNEYPRPEQRNE